jgi:hypothetical protein
LSSALTLVYASATILQCCNLGWSNDDQGRIEMRRVGASLAAILFSGLVGCISAGTASRPAALFSADAALATAFDDGCALAILEGRSIEELARAKEWAQMRPEDAASVGLGPNDKGWLLPSVANVSVAGWADGSCSVSVSSGDSASHRAHLLRTLQDRGLTMTPGLVDPAARGGVRTTYCSAESPPHVLAVIIPGPGPGADEERQALVATLFRAQGLSPSFCGARPSG